MTDEEKTTAWVNSRPDCVRKLIKEFPAGTVLHMPDGETLYVIGYTENDMLIVAAIDPVADYHAATDAKNRQYVCAQHVRDALQGESRD